MTNETSNRSWILITLYCLGYVAALGAAYLMVSCGNAPADKILSESGQASLVFVKENSRPSNNNNAMRSNRDEYHPGSDIYILTPISSSGELTNLTAQYTQAGQDDPDDYGHACDPEISFDGTKILFSMRKNDDENWHIYEMNTDGTELLQLTDQVEGDDMDPVYLPNGQIMFASTRPGIVDEYERRLSPLLHVADRGVDGRMINIRQVSFNQSHDVNPMVHSSGKIFYSRWEHLGNPNKFPIFVMSPDGTKTFVLYGNHSPRESGSRVFLEPREMSDGGIVCSVMERNSPFEGGAIGIIDISSSDDNIEFVTPETSPFNNTNRGTEAVYKTPHPIIDPTASSGREEKILFSMSPYPVNMDGMSNDDEVVDYGLYIMDKDGKNVQLIHNDPDYNEIDAVPVLPREELPGGMPQVIPSTPEVQAALNNGTQTGFFFDGNVYDRADNDGQMRPSATHVNRDGSQGQARYLRILEAVAMPADGNMRGAPIGNTNLEKQRVVGYADIREDGSFSVEVPANRSLHMQTLDENGMMLVNQITWVQVMPGEQRLCTGCHDSHNRDKIINDFEIQSDLQVFNRATGQMFSSGFQNAQNVQTHVAARTDTVDFFDKLNPTRTNTVQAVFDAQCVTCHNTAAAAGGLRLENLAEDLLDTDEETSVYEILTSSGYVTAEGGTMDYVTDDGARRSPLLWVMHNTQLNDDDDDFRTLTYDHSELWVRDEHGRLDPFLPGNEGLLRLIEWVDAGTQYSNSIDQE